MRRRPADEHDRAESAAPAPSKPPTAEMSEEAGQAEVLVLTEMVQDDGSVVSLQSAVASAPPQPDEASVDSLLRKSLLAETAPSSARFGVDHDGDRGRRSRCRTQGGADAAGDARRRAGRGRRGRASKPKLADALPDKLPAWLSPTPSPTSRHTTDR